MGSSLVLLAYGLTVLNRTRLLWKKQDQHVGDRHRLFAAVSEVIEATTVLYPGSFVDLAPSFVWPSVTYIDVDRRAHRFFADEDGIRELLSEHGADPTTHPVRFMAADYREDVDLPEASFDLLISLYAGFVSESCTRYLRCGGALLVNPSHGDAAMVSIDHRYRLQAVVTSRAGGYTVSADDLGSYLVPKRGAEVTPERLHDSGRGVAYTKSPFGYIFERVG